MPNWFYSDLINAYLSGWVGEIVFMVLAGYVAGAISLVLTGIRRRK